MEWRFENEGPGAIPGLFVCPGDGRAVSHRAMLEDDGTTLARIGFESDGTATKEVISLGVTELNRNSTGPVLFDSWRPGWDARYQRLRQAISERKQQ